MFSDSGSVPCSGLCSTIKCQPIFIGFLAKSFALMKATHHNLFHNFMSINKEAV